MELLHYILEDIKEPITYLPAGFLTGIVAELLLCCAVHRGRKKQKAGRAAADILPFGMLLPAVSRKVRFGCVLGASLGMSATVELLQLVTQRGYCQADDILMNKLGGDRVFDPALSAK